MKKLFFLIFVIGYFGVLAFILYEQAEVDIHDEVNMYLFLGQRWFHEGRLIALDWGPLYSCWYALLSLFTSSGWELYNLNSFLILGLLGISSFNVLYTISRNRGLSLLLATLICLNPHIGLISRKVNLFALIIVLIFMNLAWKNKEKSLWTYLTLGLGLASLARPELSLGAFGAGLFSLIKEKGFIIRVTPFLLFLGFIFLMPGHQLTWDGKSFAVFQSKTAERWELQGKAPGLSPNQIWEKVYAGANKISEAIINNPSEFLGHIKFNVGALISQIGEGLQLFFAVFETSILLLIGFIVLVVSKFMSSSRTSSIDPALLKTLLVINLPSFVAMVFFGPLPQYLAFFYVSLIILLVSIGKDWNFSSRSIALASIVVLLSRPDLTDSMSYQQASWRTYHDLSMREFLKDLQGKEGRVLIVPNTFAQLLPSQMKTEFIASESELKRGLVSRSWELIFAGDDFRQKLKDLGGSFQNFWQDFTQNPRSFGYEKLQSLSWHQDIYRKITP